MRLALALVMVLAGEAAATCPAANLVDISISPDDLELVPGGGIVYETQAIMGAAAGGTIVAFRAGGKRVHRRVDLAPTLWVLQTPAGKGDVVLVGGNEDTEIKRFARRKAGPKLAAPKLASATSNLARDDGSIAAAYATDTVSTTVELAAEPPAGAIAIVFYVGRERVGRGWYRILPSTSTTFSTAAGGMRCGPAQGGELDVRIGERVRAAWVDKHGRLSPASKTIVVRKAATP